MTGAREFEWASPDSWAASKESGRTNAWYANVDWTRNSGRPQHGGADGQGLFTLEFALPDIDDNEGMIDPDDLMTRQLMNKIRNDCKVKIIHYTSQGYLCIQGHRLRNIHDAMQAVRELLATTAKELVQRMIITVHRSSPTSHDPILLQDFEKLRGPRSGIGYRGVTDSKDCLLTVHEGDVDPLTAEDLARYIGQAATRIRPVNGALFMRVHLGSFVSHKRQKRKGQVVDRFETTAEFQTFLDQAVSRGTVHVSHALGDASLNLRVRNRIYAAAKQMKQLKGLEQHSAQRYLPSNMWHGDIWDMKPTYCLIFFTANRRIEIDICEATSGKGARYRKAAPRVFANNAKSAAVEVVVTCPDKAFDWHVAVEADIAAHGLPEEYKKLVQALRFKNADTATEYEFPIVEVPETALLAAKIEDVACKVSWTFECRDRPYNVECSVYHEWTDSALSKFLHRKRAPHQPPTTIVIDTAKQTPRPRKACGISVYGQTWDSDLIELSPTKHDFVPNFVDTFFNNKLHQDPLNLSRGFLDELEFLVDVVSAEDVQSERVQSQVESTTLL